MFDKTFFFFVELLLFGVILSEKCSRAQHCQCHCGVAMLHCLLLCCCLAARVLAAGLLDTDSFLSEGKGVFGLEFVGEVSERSRNVRNIIDTNSFLAPPAMVMKAKKGSGVLKKNTPPSDEESVAISEEDESIIFDRAMTYFNENQYLLAIRTMEELISHSPNDSNYHFNLGTFFLKAGHVTKALDALEKSFRINPNEIRALLNYGVVVQGMGDFKLASSTYR